MDIPRTRNEGPGGLGVSAIYTVITSCLWSRIAHNALVDKIATGFSLVHCIHYNLPSFEACPLLPFLSIAIAISPLIKGWNVEQESSGEKARCTEGANVSSIDFIYSSKWCYASTVVGLGRYFPHKITNTRHVTLAFRSPLKMDNRIAESLMPGGDSGEVGWTQEEEPKLPVTLE